MRHLFWLVHFFSTILASQNIPADSILLEHIAGELFFRDGFIYTLNRMKPMSYGVCMKALNFEAMIINQSNYFAWLILKEYSKNTDFLLIEEPCPYSKYNVSIFFIHKIEFLKCLYNNMDLFKKELGADFDPEGFFDKIANGHLTLRKSIKNSDTLLGVLLGYGEQNSKFFSENCYGLPIQAPRRISNSESIIIGPIPAPIRLITPCRFVGTKFNNDELKKKFRDDYLKLCKKYTSSADIKLIIQELRK